MKRSDGAKRSHDGVSNSWDGVSKSRDGLSKSSGGGKKKSREHSLILCREELHELFSARGGHMPRSFVTIDFESFFGTRPSEVALACVNVADGSVVASFHSFVAPSFVLAQLDVEERKSLDYVQRKVTAIPLALPEARRDYGALLLEMLQFIQTHDVDKLGVVFAKACALESKCLWWLAEQGGLELSTLVLPRLGECEDLIQVVLGHSLARNTFNIFVKSIAFKLDDCCLFHQNKNRALKPNRDPFHCALQDARTFGEMVVTARSNSDRIESVDAVERKKDAEEAERLRIKREEEKLLFTVLPWVLQCRGEGGRLFVGRTPRTAAEAEAVEKLGITCAATYDDGGGASDDPLLGSDLGVVRLHWGVSIPQIEEQRATLKTLLARGDETILLCAREVRHFRDAFFAFRAIDSRRTTKQIEVEWKMLCQANPAPNNAPLVKYADASQMKKHLSEMTICMEFNANACKAEQCALRHICKFCKNPHSILRCPKAKKQQQMTKE